MENQSTPRRASRLFTSRFRSCRFGNVSDVVENSIITTQNPPTVHPIEPVSSTIQIRHSMSKPRSSAMTNNGEKEAMKVVSEPKNLYLGAVTEGRTVIPISPLNLYHKEKAKESIIVKNSSSSNGGWFSSEEDEEEVPVDGENDTFFSLSSDFSDSPIRKMSSSPRKISTTRRRRGKSSSSEMGRPPFEVSASSTNSTTTSSESGKNNTEACRRTARTSRKTGKARRRNGPGSFQLFIESEVQESMDVSGSSTEYFCPNSGSSRQKTPKSRRRRSGDRSCEIRRCPLVMGGRVEESYAVEKTSRDPCRDFRASMVEMIVEKNIYGAEDLQKLLQCFLSLNSSNHHGVILEVFSQICQALQLTR